MIKIGEQIFQIIKRMDKSEKRAFKLYISKYTPGKNKNIEILYNTFNKLKTFDSNILQKQLEKKIDSKNIHYEKFRLKKILLDSLHDLHKNGGRVPSPGEIINKIDLGFRFKLGEIIKEWIEKGYQYAEENSNTAFKMLITQYELDYYTSLRAMPTVMIEKKESIIENAQNLIADLEYSIMTDKVADWYARNIGLKNENSEKEREVIFNNELFQVDDANLSFKQKDSLYAAKGFYYSYTEDSEKEIEFKQKIIENYEDYPKRLSKDSSKYIARYNNLVLAFLMVNRTEEAEEKITALEELPKKLQLNSPVFLQGVKSSVLFLKINLYNIERRFRESLELKDDIQILLEDQNPLFKFYHFENLCFRVSEAFFAMEQYEECLEWIEKFYKVSSSEQYQRPRVDAKIFEYCCHLELKHEFVLDSIMESLRYYLTKYEIKKEEYNMILKTVKKVKDDNLGDNDITAFGDFLSETENSPDLIEIYHWLRKKDKQKSIAS